jgi:hypothetical protein
MRMNDDVHFGFICSDRNPPDQKSGVSDMLQRMFEPDRGLSRAGEIIPFDSKSKGNFVFRVRCLFNFLFIHPIILSSLVKDLRPLETGTLSLEDLSESVWLLPKTGAVKNPATIIEGQFSHKKWNPFFFSQLQHLIMELFSAHKNDRCHVHDFSGADYLGIVEAGKQQGFIVCIGMTLSQQIAHEIPGVDSFDGDV